MSPSDVVLQVGLLVTYPIALEMSFCIPSTAYTAQPVCLSATQVMPHQEVLQI